MAGPLVAALFGQRDERPVLERDRLNGLLAADVDRNNQLLAADRDSDRGLSVGDGPSDAAVYLHDAGVAGGKSRPTASDPARSLRRKSR